MSGLQLCEICGLPTVKYGTTGDLLCHGHKNEKYITRGEEIIASLVTRDTIKVEGYGFAPMSFVITWTNSMPIIDRDGIEKTITTFWIKGDGYASGAAKGKTCIRMQPCYSGSQIMDFLSRHVSRKTIHFIKGSDGKPKAFKKEEW